MALQQSRVLHQATDLQVYGTTLCQHVKVRVLELEITTRNCTEVDRADRTSQRYAKHVRTA